MQVLWIDYVLSAGFSLVGGLGDLPCPISPLITAVSPQSLLIMAKKFFQVCFQFLHDKGQFDQHNKLEDANFTVLLKYQSNNN